MGVPSSSPVSRVCPSELQAFPDTEKEEVVNHEIYSHSAKVLSVFFSFIVLCVYVWNIKMDCPSTLLCPLSWLIAGQVLEPDQRRYDVNCAGGDNPCSCF